MTRWISSAIFTVAIIVLCFFLPVWNFQKSVANSVQMDEDDTSISVVSVVKKRKAVQTQSVSNKIQNTVKTSPQPKTPEKKQSVPTEKQVIKESVEEEPPEVITETIAEENVSESEVLADEPALDSSSAEGAEGDEEGALKKDENIAPVAPEKKIEESEDVKKMNAAYKKYALTRIASKKSYPYKARSQGIEGKVKVKIVIAQDGSVKQAEIVEKCDSELLNDACLEAIKKAAPFKKMKSGMSDMTLTFVMDFALE